MYELKIINYTREKNDEIKIYRWNFRGVTGLTNCKIYECIAEEGPFYRVIDDSDEDYLYSQNNPAPLDGSSKGGKWEDFSIWYYDKYDQVIKDIDYSMYINGNRL